MRIATWCGSLGEGSANAVVLATASKHLAQQDVEVDPVPGPSAVPAFVPDVADPLPVTAIRAAVEASDGILLAAPEYAGGLAGAMKNALDWLVGSGALYRTPIAVASAGSTGGRYAIEQLVRTLSWQGAWVVATLAVDTPRTKITEGQIVHDATNSAVEAWASSLHAAVAASPVERLAMVARVVTAYGIDVARFGEP